MAETPKAGPSGPGLACCCAFVAVVLLEEAALLEADKRPVANDHVVGEFDPEHVGCLDEVLRHADVLRARLRVARRVVVREHQCRCVGDDRIPQQFGGPHDGGVMLPW